MTHQGNPYADALENARCDELEREEREAEARKVADQERLVAAHNEMVDVQNASFREARRTPRVPELGAPIAEVRTICESNLGGLRIDRDERYDVVYDCRVGGVSVFWCGFEGHVTIRCDGFLEGADLAASRDALAKRLGPPEREALSSEGYRVFVWPGGTVAMTMYPGGVRVMTQRVTQSSRPASASVTR